MIANSNSGNDSSADIDIDRDLRPGRVRTGALLASGQVFGQHRSSMDSNNIDTSRDTTAATGVSDSMRHRLCTTRRKTAKGLGE